MIDLNERREYVQRWNAADLKPSRRSLCVQIASVRRTLASLYALPHECRGDLWFEEYTNRLHTSLSVLQAAINIAKGRPPHEGAKKARRARRRREYWREHWLRKSS